MKVNRFAPERSYGRGCGRELGLAPRQSVRLLVHHGMAIRRCTRLSEPAQLRVGRRPAGIGSALRGWGSPGYRGPWIACGNQRLIKHVRACLQFIQRQCRRVWPGSARSAPFHGVQLSEGSTNRSSRPLSLGFPNFFAPIKTKIHSPQYFERNKPSGVTR